MRKNMGQMQIMVSQVPENGHHGTKSENKRGAIYVPAYGTKADNSNANAFQLKWED
ncbi:MAG: hypothetical protein ABIG96_05345 [Candidatus Micrarchaeota archaeon]